jgi:hypothetical protein
VHFDHGESIPFAICEELGSQAGYLMRSRESARRELQKSPCCRSAIGDAVEVVITETWAESRGNGLDRVTELELGKVDGAPHDGQQVRKSSDQGAEGRAEIGKIHR